MTVSRMGFGALPIQRVDFDVAGALLRRAYEAGVTLFDTARAYSDSEQKVGAALGDVRRDIIIATKTMGATGKEVFADAAASLAALGTDYIDIYQFHNPTQIPRPGDGTGRYEAVADLRERGVVRAIGVTCHGLRQAREAVESGVYDTLQYPLSCLSSLDETDLATACEAAGMGLLGMKAMAGGLIAHPEASFAFLRGLPAVVPIWGVQRPEELEQFLSLEANPPAIDAAMQEAIEAERGALSGGFCRSCGYCMPCPVGIPLHQAGRIMHLIRRAPPAQFVTPEYRALMARAEQCTACGQCAAKCPYHLDVPRLVAEQYAEYQAYCREVDTLV